MRSWPDVSTGRRTRPSFWTTLQDAVDEIEGGEVALPLAGIEGALGAYEPLKNIRAGNVNLLDFLPRDPILDGSEDYTEEVLGAIAAAKGESGSKYATNGGRCVISPPGVIGISDNLPFDASGDWIGLQGYSAGLTTFKALGADARITLASNWARSGGFTFDGNGLADVGVYLSVCNGMVLDNIHAYNCAGNGIETHNLQNAVISALHAEGNRGHGIVVDDGTGSSTFLQCHSYSNHKHQLWVTDSDSVAEGGFPEPRYNQFLGGIAEYQAVATSGTATSGSGTTLVHSGAGWTVNEWAGGWVTMDPGGSDQEGMKIVSNTADTLTVDGTWAVTPTTESYRIHFAPVRHDAGYQNILYNFQINPGTYDDPGEFPLLEVGRRGLTEDFSLLMVHLGSFIGRSTYNNVGIELDGAGATIVIEDERTTLGGVAVGIRAHNESGSRIEGTFPTMNGVTTPFVAVGGFSLAGTSFLRQRRLQQLWTRGAATDRAFYVAVDGDAGIRHEVLASGLTRWGDGSGITGDTNLYRNGADQLKTDDKLLAAAGIGVGNSASATTLGTVTKKIEVFDASGASLGFVPVYGSIT